MHLCLTIPEILRLIVEEACVTSQWQLFMLDENSVDTRTAYALARTCRNFLEPALDILWTCQRDLNFLISCMPDKLLEGRMTVAGAVHMHLTRVIYPKDWDRFLVYASRIKSLRLFTPSPPFSFHRDGTTSARLSFDTWVALSLSRPPGPLLPNLQRLFWCTPTAETETTQFVHMFLAPRLQVFQLRIYCGQGDCVSEALLHLPRVTPKLQTLDVHYRTREPPLLGRYFPEVLRGLKHIQEFRWVCAVSSDQLSALCATQSRSLRLLSIVLDDAGLGSQGWPLNTQPEGDLTRTLPNLTELELYAHSSSSCIAALTMCDFPRLSVLSLKTGAYRVLSQVFQAIHNQCPHAKLHTISLETVDELYPDDDSDDFYRSVIDASTLRPIYAFRAMTSISLSNCVDPDSDEPRFRFQLDDLAILELAMAWPQLSSLHLGPTGWRRTSSTTLKGLKHLVQHCRYLAALSISVDAVNPPDTLDTAVDNIPTRCNELITTIDFMDSSVRDPCDVAAYLHFLFPRLVTIRREDYDDDALESWRQVERSLVSMNKARVWQSRMLERDIDTTTT